MSERFTQVEDGWHQDGTTGLQWSATATERMTHAEAAAWCASVGGRLPTIGELAALTDYALANPCTAMPDTTSSYYWSSSAYVPDVNLVWVADCSDGGVHAFQWSANLFVRDVRSAA